MDELGTDAHILETQAWQSHDKGIRIGVEPCGDEVDEFDLAFFMGTGFKKFLFTGANGLFSKLALHDFQLLSDFLRVHRGAIAAQKKLGDICGKQVGPGCVAGRPGHASPAAIHFLPFRLFSVSILVFLIAPLLQIHYP